MDDIPLRGVRHVLAPEHAAKGRHVRWETISSSIARANSCGRPSLMRRLVGLAERGSREAFPGCLRPLSRRATFGITHLGDGPSHPAVAEPDESRTPGDRCQPTHESKARGL